MNEPAAAPLYIVAAAITAIGLPAYLGWIHQPVWNILVYAPGAGLSLALGERLEKERIRIVSVPAIIEDAVMRGAALLVPALISFGLAVWLI